jgi:hypothetical protein
MKIELDADDMANAISEYLSKKITVTCDVKVFSKYDEIEGRDGFYFNIETKEDDELED